MITNHLLFQLSYASTRPRLSGVSAHELSERRSIANGRTRTDDILITSRWALYHYLTELHSHNVWAEQDLNLLSDYSGVLTLSTRVPNRKRKEVYNDYGVRHSPPIFVRLPLKLSLRHGSCVSLCCVQFLVPDATAARFQRPLSFFVGICATPTSAGSDPATHLALASRWSDSNRRQGLAPRSTY